MIGILLAIALTQQPTTCTVVNLSPVSIVCNEGPQQIELRDFIWPREVWGQTHLTGRYNAEIVDGQVFPLPTGPVVDNEAINHRQVLEGKRWRRHALQAPDKDLDPKRPVP
jgi:hypothetical protein